MKRVTFVVAGFIVVFISLLLIKPDDIYKTKHKKSNFVFMKNKTTKTFELFKNNVNLKSIV